MEILRIVVHPQKNFSQKENTVKKKSLLSVGTKRFACDSIASSY